MPDPIIEVHSASKMFGRVTALDRVSCAVEAGEVVGLLGPNGSGKTTLIRLLCVYFPPTSGSVCVAGYDTRVAPLQVRRRVGYALEGVVLYPDLTVSDFLSFVGTVKNITVRQLDTVIARCGLGRIDSFDREGRLIQRVIWVQELSAPGPVSKKTPEGRSSYLTWGGSVFKDYTTGFWAVGYPHERTLNPPLPETIYNTNTLLQEPKTVDFYRK